MSGKAKAAAFAMDNRDMRQRLFGQRYERWPAPFAECVYCGDPAQTGDHVPPLAAAHLFSEDARFRIVPVCAECNEVLGTWPGVCLRARAAFLGYWFVSAVSPLLKAGFKDEARRFVHKSGRCRGRGEVFDWCGCFDCYALGLATRPSTVAEVRDDIDRYWAERDALALVGR